MNKEPLISVIVPVFGIERYIGLCIESIINQTYKNIEIILVDDGSNDRCPEICDLYAKKDERIKVTHKSNGGLVSARKAGLHEANGAYISYVDGDDWIDNSFIEELYQATVTHGADIVCAGFTRDLFNKSVSFTNNLALGVYEGDALKNLWGSMISFGSFYRPGISTYVWNKLFARDVIHDVQNAVDNRISIGEDGAVTYPALLKCERVAVVKNADYHYRQREDSMLKKSTSYSVEAQKLKWLYEYLKHWSKDKNHELSLESQIIDYVLSIALIRSGGRLSYDDYSVFNPAYYGKNIVIYSAGTFGQQLANRLKEYGQCNIVGWVDDDYWEYRRCCLDVDPPESVRNLTFDYVLVATVDSDLANKIMDLLIDMNIEKSKILTINVPQEKEQLLNEFLDIKSLKVEEEKRKQGVLSHA